MCCPPAGGHRRRRTQTCSPTTCSPPCATVFVPFIDACASNLQAVGQDLSPFFGLNVSCHQATPSALPSGTENQTNADSLSPHLPSGTENRTNSDSTENEISWWVKEKMKIAGGGALLAVLMLAFAGAKCFKKSARKKSAKTEILLKELVAIDVERQNNGHLWSGNNNEGWDRKLQGAGWADEAL